MDASLCSHRVGSVLEILAEIRGLPEVITIDNGPEFAGRMIYRKGVKLNLKRPGKLIENAYIESFNGRSRDESLNANWFISLKAYRVVEGYYRNYNESR